MNRVLQMALWLMLGGITFSRAQDRHLRDFPLPRQLSVDTGLSRRQISELVRTVRYYYAFWNSGRESEVEESVSVDLIDHTPAIATLPGYKGLLATVASMRNATPDLRCEIEDLIVSAAKVACRVSFTGHQAGAAPENQVKFTVIEILYIKNGKINECWRLASGQNNSLMSQ